VSIKPSGSLSSVKVVNFESSAFTASVMLGSLGFGNFMTDMVGAIKGRASVTPSSELLSLTLSLNL